MQIEKMTEEEFLMMKQDLADQVKRNDPYSGLSPEQRQALTRLELAQQLKAKEISTDPGED